VYLKQFNIIQVYNIQLCGRPGNLIITKSEEKTISIIWYRLIN